MENFARIPEPPETFLLGHLFALSANAPVQDMVKLARELGPIYRLEIRGRIVIVVSGHHLVNELSDESRFDKSIRGALKLVRRFAGDGLFTAKTEEPNWSRAHNILLPNFSQKAMQSYHQMMLDIAEQLVLKWSRLNPDEEIEVTRDMTSLTVDTIGLCGFDYRFNSFYHDKEHPFVGAMSDALGITMDELRDVPMENLIRQSRDRQFADSVRTMNETVDKLIRDRRAEGEGAANSTDLLGYMLTGVDRKSGEKLDDVNIRNQVITFLIAGHETTSGLLSFAIYALMNNPQVLEKAYAEVDRVLGRDLEKRPTYAQVNKLSYIGQILKETLRLWPTAPAFTLHPYEETTLAGKYKVKPYHQITVLLPMLHRDPTVWGPDPERFDPDNFSPENESLRPPNAYKPFGNGQRACIGRQFALQEATLVLGMLLQRFKFVDHTRYSLKIRESLTMKPDDFRIKVRHRSPEAVKPVELASNQPSAVADSTAAALLRHDTPLLALYGSNMGSSEEAARKLAESAYSLGFASKIAPLDDYAGRLPQEGLLLIAVSSYNGLPPDNATRFCNWLTDSERKPGELSGVRYAVFGSGNRDWANTFQAVPRLIDSRLAELGAKRIFDLGQGDQKADYDGAFQSWATGLWGPVGKALGLRLEQTQSSNRPLFALEVVTGLQNAPFLDSLGARAFEILVNRELQTPESGVADSRSTKHIEFRLPDGVSYRAGDHLGVIPVNGDEVINRVASRFGFGPETFIRLRLLSARKSFLPTDQPVKVRELLANYVELQDVATRSQLRSLAEYTECPPEKIRLQALVGDDPASDARYVEEILTPRRSVIELLEEYRSCMLPFEVFLEMLPPLRPRYYSISSSPLASASACSATVAVVRGPARSGNGIFEGVCSNYLSNAVVGQTVRAFVKDTGSSFRLPEDLARPVIMVGPGTGFAPFRGFIEELAARRLKGDSVGEALLFFGCRHPELDNIYSEELADYSARGVVRVVKAFSRLDPERKDYVQDRIYAEKDEVWRMLEANAVVYVCGDATRMAPDVKRTFAAIYEEKTGYKDGLAWVEKLISQGRYLVDVWSSG